MYRNERPNKSKRTLTYQGGKLLRRAASFGKGRNYTRVAGTESARRAAKRNEAEQTTTGFRTGSYNIPLPENFLHSRPVSIPAVSIPAAAIPAAAIPVNLMSNNVPISIETGVLMPTGPRRNSKSNSKSKPNSKPNSKRNSKPSSPRGRANIETNVNKINRLKGSLYRRLGNYGGGRATLNRSTFETDKFKLHRLILNKKGPTEAARVLGNIEEANRHATVMRLSYAFI